MSDLKFDSNNYRFLLQPLKNNKMFLEARRLCRLMSLKKSSNQNSLDLLLAVEKAILDHLEYKGKRHRREKKELNVLSNLDGPLYRILYQRGDRTTESKEIDISILYRLYEYYTMKGNHNKALSYVYQCEKYISYFNEYDIKSKFTISLIEIIDDLYTLTKDSDNNMGLSFLMLYSKVIENAVFSDRRDNSEDYRRFLCSRLIEINERLFLMLNELTYNDLSDYAKESLFGQSIREYQFDRIVLSRCPELRNRLISSSKLKNVIGKDTLDAELLNLKSMLADSIRYIDKETLSESQFRISQLMTEIQAKNSEESKGTLKSINISSSIEAVLESDEVYVMFFEVSDSSSIQNYVVSLKAKNKNFDFIKIEDTNISYSKVDSNNVSISDLRGLQVTSFNNDSLRSEIICKSLANVFKDSINRIYYYSEGWMRNISIGSLKRDTKYVIDDFQLTNLLYPESILVKNESILRLSENGNSVFLYGGADFTHTSTNVIPFFDEDIRFEWTSLSGTSKEVDEIALLLSTNKIEFHCFKDLECSEDIFEANSDSNSVSIIHLASHGFSFDNMRFAENIIDGLGSEHLAGLVLSSSSNGLNDGYLTSFEIGQNDFRNTKLVVLSACSSGVGLSDWFNGVLGVHQAFKIAGVENVIYSLWDVPDESTNILMKEFYKQFIEHSNISIALQNAQRHTKILYPDPLYWAGFVHGL